MGSSADPPGWLQAGVLREDSHARAIIRLHVCFLTSKRRGDSPRLYALGGASGCTTWSDRAGPINEQQLGLQGTRDSDPAAPQGILSWRYRLADCSLDRGVPRELLCLSALVEAASPVTACAWLAL